MPSYPFPTGRGGMGPGGLPMPGTEPGTEAAGSTDEGANLMEVAVYGIATVYERPPVKTQAPPSGVPAAPPAATPEPAAPAAAPEAKPS